jgi:hypothetical protein
MYDPLAQCLSNKDTFHPGNNICLHHRTQNGAVLIVE